MSVSKSGLKRRIVYVRSSGIFDDSRASKEIRALYSYGYNVVVIGWDRTGVGTEKCKEIFKDTDIEFIFYNKRVLGGIGFRGILKLVGFFRFVNDTLKKLRGVSAIHACDLDGALGSIRFSKRKHIPLVYDIYDYYIDSHSIPGLLQNIVEKLEINVINYSETTIICTEERRQQIKKAHPKRVKVIYNSPDIQDNEENIDVKYDYVYCGAFEERRLIEEILDEYKKHEELKFIFAGSGKYDEKVEAVAKNENFSYLGRIPYETVLQVEKESRIISAIYEPTVRNHILCAPNKFYEALALGKPVIVCEGTGIDKIVKTHKLGRVIRYSVRDFYEAVYSLMESEEELVEISARGKELYSSTYKWSLMAEILCEIYRECFRDHI